MKIILEKEAEDFLEKNNFNVVERKYARKKQDLKKIKIAFPWAVKVSSKKAIHKAKVGGVALNIQNITEAEKAFEKMQNIDGFEGVLIQRMIKGAFLIFGLKNTPEFGLTIMFGEGGGDVEKKKDVVFRVCPATEKDIDEMMKETKVYEKLKKTNLDINSVKKNLVLLSKLAEKHSEIKELDINPLVVNEKETIVVDARIVTI